MARLALLCLLLLTVPACGRTTAPLAPSAAMPSTPADAGPLAAEMFTRVNDHRVAMGLPPLAWHPGAAVVALAHSDDMVKRAYFSHQDPDGRDPAERLTDAGIAYWAAGENIASGFPDAAGALDGWLASPGHRENLESPDYTHQGIGVVDGVWTHVFLTPREPALVASDSPRAASVAAPPHSPDARARGASRRP